MFSRRLGYEIAILVVVCTVALFLFPTARGTYSAVHGPVTALLSFHTRIKLRLGMALAGLRFAGRMVPSGSEALRIAWLEIFLLQSAPQGQIAVLRC